MLEPVDDKIATNAEMLLRALAAGDDSSLRAVLARVPRPASRGSPRALPVPGQGGSGPSRSALGHGLIDHFAAEIAFQAGVAADEIVEVLVIVAATVGAARVVDAAPRLALAIGYDIEVEGWDGD